jgi:ubiquinone/menaquinone biosynthesis C-methylase UbiE
MLATLTGRLPAGGLLVDVGGGTGVGSEEAGRVAPPGAYRRRVVIEPQWGMLSRGAAHHPRSDSIEWVRGDAVRLPLPDGSADVVLAIGLLCCMTDAARPRAISELWRVLRPGGSLLVSVPKYRGAADDPALESAGFQRVRLLRPGRALWARPAS